MGGLRSRAAFLPSLFAIGVVHAGGCSVDSDGHTFGSSGAGAHSGGNAGRNAGGASGSSAGGSSSGGASAGKQGAGGAAQGGAGGSGADGSDLAGAGGSSQGGSDVGSGGTPDAGSSGNGDEGGSAGDASGGDANGGTGGEATGGVTQGGASGGTAQGGSGARGGSGGTGGGTSCGTGCKNGGTCNASNVCVCKAGYNGTYCENDINDCTATACKNGGTCVDGVNSYTCQCKGGWVGPSCSDAVFQGLGFLPGGTSSRAYGLSSDGTTVVGDSLVGQAMAGFHWKLANGMRALPMPSDGSTYESSNARAVSANGLVVAGGANPGVDEPYRGVVWIAGVVSGIYQGTTNSGVTTAAYLNAINQDGTIVAGSEPRDGDGARAARWTNQGRTNLMANSYSESYARAMTPDGSVVVGYTSEPSSAFRWTAAGGGVALPFSPGATDAGASGVSADGTIIVGGCDGVAVRWVNAGQPVSLGIPGYARAVNADGSVIVGSTTQGTVFIWRGSVALLSEVLTEAGANLTGWTLTEVVAVSANGKVIAGTGEVAGVSQAFIARLP